MFMGNIYEFYTIKLCEKCGNVLGYDSYLKQYFCGTCGFCYSITDEHEITSEILEKIKNKTTKEKIRLLRNIMNEIVFLEEYAKDD